MTIVHSFSTFSNPHRQHIAVQRAPAPRRASATRRYKDSRECGTGPTCRLAGVKLAASRVTCRPPLNSPHLSPLQKAPPPAATRTREREHRARFSATTTAPPPAALRRGVGDTAGGVGVRRTLVRGCGAQLTRLQSPPTVRWLRWRRDGEGLASWGPRGRRREVVHLPPRRHRRLPGQPRRRAARGPRALPTRPLHLCTQM